MATIAQRLAALEAWKSAHISGHVLSGHTHPADATDADVAALDQRVDALEVGPPVIAPPVEPSPPVPPPTGTFVRVTSIPALLTALANNTLDEIVVANGTYRVSAASSKQSNSLWIGAKFAARTRPIVVRAETTGGVTFDGGGTVQFGGITFAEGAHHQTWEGFRWANARSSAGVIFFGGILDSAPPHHITLRNITVAGSVTSDRPNLNHAVYFSWAGGGGVHDILIDGLTADGSGGLQSAIHMYHSQAGNPNAWNVTIRNLVASNFDQAIIIWDATLTNIVIEDATVTNSGRFAVRYELGGTLILRRVVSTGSGDQGFYSSLGANPPGVTFDNCSLG